MLSWAVLSAQKVATRVHALEIMNFEFDESVGFRTIEKLAQRLSILMGATSFQALLERALSRSTTEVRWLGEFKVDASGQLVFPSTACSMCSSEGLFEGEIALLAHLLALLVLFIGPSLTFKLVGEIWPQIFFEFSELGNADDY